MPDRLVFIRGDISRVRAYCAFRVSGFRRRDAVLLLADARNRYDCDDALGLAERVLRSIRRTFVLFVEFEKRKFRKQLFRYIYNRKRGDNGFTAYDEVYGQKKNSRQVVLFTAVRYRRLAGGGARQGNRGGVLFEKLPRRNIKPLDGADDARDKHYYNSDNAKA